MNYAQIRKYDIANGEGVRTTLFVSGCKFNCPNCFNHEYLSFNFGNEFDENVKKVLYEYLEDQNVVGLSILGGDPLWQTNQDIDILIEVCKYVRSIGKNTWIWSGFIWESLNKKQMELVSLCDVFIDGQFKEELKNISLKWKGSSNQRAIDVFQTILNKNIVLYM